MESNLNIDHENGRIQVLTLEIDKTQAVRLALKKLCFFTRYRAEIINEPQLIYNGNYLASCNYMHQTETKNIQYIMNNFNRYAVPIENNISLCFEERTVPNKTIFDQDIPIGELRRIFEDNMFKYFFRKYSDCPKLEIQSIDKVYRGVWVVDIFIKNRKKQISVPADNYIFEGRSIKRI